MFQLSLQMLSGAVRLCQIHVILCQTLSGDIRYMVDIRYTCHIMSASIKWCQLLSDSVRWCQVLRSEQQQGQHHQQQLGSCTRALVKGPAQGPLVRVLPKGPGEGHALIYVLFMYILIYVIALLSAAPARICVHLQPSSSRAPSSTSCEPG